MLLAASRTPGKRKNGTAAGASLQRVPPAPDAGVDQKLSEAGRKRPFLLPARCTYTMLSAHDDFLLGAEFDVSRLHNGTVPHGGPGRRLPRYSTHSR